MIKIQSQIKKENLEEEHDSNVKIYKPEIGEIDSKIIEKDFEARYGSDYFTKDELSKKNTKSDSRNSYSKLSILNFVIFTTIVIPLFIYTVLFF